MGGPAPAKPRGRLGGREEVGLSGGEGGEGDPEGHAVRAPHTLSLITLGGAPLKLLGQMTWRHEVAEEHVPSCPGSEVRVRLALFTQPTSNHMSRTIALNKQKAFKNQGWSPG